MHQTRATTPADAYWAFDPFAVIKPGDPWYEDLGARLGPRHYGLADRLARHLRPGPNAPDFVQIAVLGQSGVGKTTQVRGALAGMRDVQLFPVFVDAQSEFDPADIDFADVLFTIGRMVLATLRDHRLDVPETEGELLLRYFDDEQITRIESRETSGEARAGVQAGAGLPFVGRILGRFRGSFKADSTYRRQARELVQREPQELIRRVNVLLDAATKAVEKVRGAGHRLLIVLDNLEKFEKRSVVERAVISRASELRELRAHLVAFLHPADQYAPRTVSASAAFQKVIAVPALPLRRKVDPVDRVDEDCLNAVRAMLDRRVDIDAIFKDQNAAIRDLLRWSGGHLRDILHIAREACELYPAVQLETQFIEEAARRLARSHDARIRPGDWERLRTVARTKDIANDPVDGYLLLHLLVLEYNGDVWWDVHPYVRLDPRFETLAVGKD